jgi:hypothetical protein
VYWQRPFLKVLGLVVVMGSNPMDPKSCYKNAMPLNVKYAIRTSQMDTLEEAMTKSMEMEEIMIETGVDPDIILGKVQRQLGGLSIDNQGASSSRKNEEFKP